MNKDFVIENDILIEYKGRDEIVTIPDGIKEIGKECFYDNRFLKEIIMPDSVVKIAPSAFELCKNLNKIKFSKNLKSIGTYAFSETNLENLELSNINNINAYAFKNCPILKNIKIEANIINQGVFSNCTSLEKATLKTKKNADLFKDCINLKKIELLNNIEEINLYGICCSNNYKLIEITGPNIICEDSVVYNKNKTILLAYLEGKQDECFKIPDSVEKINKYGIDVGSKLKKLEFGKNLKELDEDSILGKYIEEIIFNNKLKKINRSIFCNRLRIIKELENTQLKEYKTEDIMSARLITIKLPNTIKKIDAGYFKENIKIKCIGNSNEIEIIDPKNMIKFINLNLNDLIDNGKSFLEANQIIKKQER